MATENPPRKPLLGNLLKNQSVKRRLALGFGVLVLLLVMSGAVSFWQLDRIDHALTRIVTIEEPLEKAVLEMEIHAGETARAILHYMHEPEDKFKAQALQSEETFIEYSEQYKRLAENHEEQMLGSQVRQTYKEFKQLGDELMAMSSKRQTALARLRQKLAAIDTMLENLSSMYGQEKASVASDMKATASNTLALAESCIAGNGEEPKSRLQAENERFLQLADQLTPPQEVTGAYNILAVLEKRWSEVVADASEICLCTQSLRRLSDRFEADLERMDHVLDNVIQPIIHRETVNAAQQAMASSRQAVTLLGLLGLLGVLFGGCIGWHISQGIVQPVSVLVKGSEIIRSGNRDHRIELKSRDEFGDLAHAFNIMVESLNKSTDDLLKSQQQAEQLRLSAAQREIERHAADARTDKLTQLYNRRAFDDMMHHHAEVDSRSDSGFIIALFDVDHFKIFNDTFGHQAGDAVLMRVASTLANSFSDLDFVARFGGEEFAVLLSECSISEAAAKVDAARKAIEEAVLCFEGDRLKVTVSGGVAFHVAGSDAAKTVHLADQALYASKDAGRNCVHVLGETRSSYVRVTSDNLITL